MLTDVRLKRNRQVPGVICNMPMLYMLGNDLGHMLPIAPRPAVLPRCCLLLILPMASR